MSLPQIAALEFEAENVVEQNAIVHKEFAFDFDKGDYITRDGDLILIEGIDYLKTWVQHMLRTQKGTLLHKDSNYGTEYQKLIGQRLPMSMFMSELERMIRESLLQNDKISGIENFNIERKGNRLIVSFKIVSDYGTTMESVVI